MITARSKGVLWFVLQCFTVSLTFAVVRFAIDSINIFTMTLIQGCFALALMLPFVLRQGIGSLKTKRIKLHIVRSVFGLIGTSSFYYGVTKISLNDATAISFTAPLFTTLAAVLILKEKVRGYRWVSMFIGLTGAVIILKPAGDFNIYALFIILSVFMMGFVQVFIAQLNKTEAVLTILFYMVVLSIILVAPLAVLKWQTPHWENIGWIFVLCCIVYINLFGVVLAYRNAPINILMPLDFTRLIFTAVIAYLIFGEHLTRATLIGSVVILAGIIYALLHERRENKKIPEL